MLQKLQDFWTFKDWEVLQRKEKRPRFGPLRKVQDSSSDKPAPVEWLNGTTKHQDLVRFAGGSGEPVKDYHKDLVADSKKLPNTSQALQPNNQETCDHVAPGFYNIQQWRDAFERKMQIPMYTGFCTSYTEYSDRLASHCNGESYDDDHSYQQDIYWNEESYYRTSHEIREHHRKSDISQLDITSGIDSDIADIAAQLMKGDSVLDVVDNMAAKDDWGSRIGFSKSVYQSQSVKTRTMKLNDCSEVVVNIIETTYPLLHRKPISNTKTPCHTPCLPIHCQNTFKQIPVSTNSLLQRSHNKLNFLSWKQKADPSNELIRSKSDCEVNFSNIWDNINQRFVVCSDRRLSRVPAVFTSTSVPISLVTENRKRKASSSFSIQPPTKRQNIATKKSQVRNQAASSYCDLFATPLFIPSKQNHTV